MEIETIKRLVYWLTYLLFMLLLAVFFTAERLSLVFRLVLIVLLAILSSRFRFEEYYSFLSILVVLIAGFFGGIVLANSAAEQWILSFLFIIMFFLSAELFERRVLGV